MKKTVLMLTVLALSLETCAVYYQSRSRGYRPTEDEKRLTPAGPTGDLKKVIEKSKTILTDKLEFDEGAKCGNTPINLKARIGSLCGHEIGTIAKVGRNTVLDANGNIVVTERLKKPFRLCTHVELKYSKVNHALYSIRIFSPAQRKMDDDAARKEVNGMIDALTAKFGEKISSWGRIAIENGYAAHFDAFTGQSLTVTTYMAEIDKRFVLQGPTRSGHAQGWAFSVKLVDQAMQSFAPDKADGADARPVEGVDAL